MEERYFELHPEEKESGFNNVLPDDKYLSSDHERESDTIRNILEENDDIYDAINYMPTFADMKDDPSRKKFLKEFQDELRK
mmetsp:Transcript_29940/g.45795  ORF Transcript_29940/g.45795 Transcript_29940/m.45795 type:complete len:81 (+) Transcript_29940:855-1097(+)